MGTARRQRVVANGGDKIQLQTKKEEIGPGKLTEDRKLALQLQAEDDHSKNKPNADAKKKKGRNEKVLLADG